MALYRGFRLAVITNRTLVLPPILPHCPEQASAKFDWGCRLVMTNPIETIPEIQQDAWKAARTLAKPTLTKENHRHSYHQFPSFTEVIDFSTFQPHHLRESNFPKFVDFPDLMKQLAGEEYDDNVITTANTTEQRQQHEKFWNLLIQQEFSVSSAIGANQSDILLKLKEKETQRIVVIGSAFRVSSINLTNYLSSSSSSNNPVAALSSGTHSDIMTNETSIADMDSFLSKAIQTFVPAKPLRAILRRVLSIFNNNNNNNKSNETSTSTVTTRTTNYIGVHIRIKDYYHWNPDIMNANCNNTDLKHHFQSLSQKLAAITNNVVINDTNTTTIVNDKHTKLPVYLGYSHPNVKFCFDLHTGGIYNSMTIVDILEQEEGNRNATQLSSLISDVNWNTIQL